MQLTEEQALNAPLVNDGSAPLEVVEVPVTVANEPDNIGRQHLLNAEPDLVE